MASTHKHIRSSTANKRPTTAIADGQIALNTNASSPGLFFKDSTGASIIKIGPVHVGSTAPNATPGAGGSSGNSTGETWLDNSLTPVGVKIWNGSAWVNATPVGSTTVQGLLELATSAETQTGTDTDRAVTPAGLQSKLSDSTSTTSSTTIASSTAVKAAYDLAAAALPLSGGIITGNLEIGTTGSLSFEGSTADAFETTIAVTDPTADRTITLPDTTGTIVTTGDTGTVTSTMILDGTILDVDVNASAAIAHSKLANITAASVLLGNASNVPTATALTGDVTVTSSGVTSISSGVIVNADVNASAAIAGTKISPDFGSQNTTTTGTSTAASFIPTSSTVPTNGVYLPAANSVAISTNGTNRFQIDSSGNITVDTNTFYVDAANNRVGVGTTSVASILHTSGSSDQAVTIQTTTAGADTRINFRNSAGTDAGGIQYLHNGNHLLFNANSGERARIDGSGRLLVGTSTARTNINSSVAPVLQVEGINHNTSSLSLTRSDASSSSNPPFIFLTATGGTTAGSNALVVNNTVDTYFGAIRFCGTDGTKPVGAAQIDARLDGTPGTNDMPGRLVFSTTADGASSPTERMRITSVGYVKASNTGNYESASGAFHELRSDTAANTAALVFATNGSYTGGVLQIGASRNTTNSTYQFLRCRHTSTDRLLIQDSGNVQNANNSYGAISDIKLKENIVDATSQWNDLKALQVRRYNFKEETGHSTHAQIGLVAQEVELVSPGLVSESPDRDAEGNDLGTVTKSVNYSVLYMKAVKALQEAMERIEQLEAEMAEVKAQLS